MDQPTSEVNFTPPTDTDMPPVIADAMVKVQAEIKDPERNLHNPHKDYMYTDLAGVLQAIRGPLTNNGLAIYQPIVSCTDHSVAIETKIVHRSGISKSYGTLELVMPKMDAQALGSMITYLRKYGAQLIGIAGEHDDDANEIAQRRHTEYQESQRRKDDGQAQRSDYRRQSSAQGRSQQGEAAESAQQRDERTSQALADLYGYFRALDKDNRAYWRGEMDKRYKTRDAPQLQLGQINNLIGLIRKMNPNIKPVRSSKEQSAASKDNTPAQASSPSEHKQTEPSASADAIEVVRALPPYDPDMDPLADELDDDPFEEPEPGICDICHVPISDRVSAYSTEHFGRPLCMDHQKENGSHEQAA